MADGRRWWSPFAPAEAPEPRRASPPPLPTLPAPKRPAKPVEASGAILGPQIARAMIPIKEEHGIGKLAEAMDVTTNTVRSCLSGVGMKLSTFEKVCQVAGWTVEVRDPDGTVIARL